MYHNTSTYLPKFKGNNLFISRFNISLMLFLSFSLCVCANTVQVKIFLQDYSLALGLPVHSRFDDLDLFQGHRCLRSINWFRLLFLFLSTVAYTLYGCYIHWKDQAQYSLSDWYVFKRPSHILQAQIFSFSVLSFCRTGQEFLQWSSVFFFFFSDDVWLFQSLLCWR